MMPKKIKITAALDSFKGAASSYAAGIAVKRGIMRRIPDCEVSVFSLGDGGEGTSAAFANLGTVHSVFVSDTHREKTEAEYVLIDKNGVKTAIFDMASAAGLKHSRRHGLDVLSATTAGVGEIIVHLVNIGCDEIIVGLGGSGTNDGGIGALSRLGAVFYDSTGIALDVCSGADVLSDIARCDLSAACRLLDGVRLTLLYDVDVPLTGEYGATRMFSPQKGACKSDIEALESAMISFSKIGDSAIRKALSEKSGAGAAGGLGYGLSLIGGKLTAGARYVLDFLDFRNAISDSSIVITGEGKTDRQTSRGKLPYTVAEYAKNAGIPVVCLCGTLEDDPSLYDRFDAVFSILNEPCTLEDAMKNTTRLLECTAYNIAGLIR